MQINFNTFKPVNQNTKPKNNAQSPKLYNLTPLKKDTISFSSNRLLFAEDFLAEACKKYGGKTENDTIERVFITSVKDAVEGKNNGY